MDIKTVSVGVNWLDEIDGMSVAKAIKYLETLNPGYTLSYYMEGDTHGCNVVSELTYQVELTKAEQFTKLEKHYTKEISLYESAKAEHERNGRLSRAESCERKLQQLRDLLAKAKTNYCD